jgi:hypothetical protein
VTAKAAGTATITVTTEDGNKTATCAVTVNEPDPWSWLIKPILNFTLNGNTLSIEVVGPGAEKFTSLYKRRTETESWQLMTEWSLEIDGNLYYFKATNPQGEVTEGKFKK